MQSNGRVVGRVAGIRVYPVKSMAGTPVQQVEIGPGGLAGDRAATVVDADGRTLRGKDAPGISGVAPTGDPDADAAALTAVVGRPVRLAPSAGGPAADVAAVHLVSRGAMDRAAAGEVPEGCSADDPRANLVLDLDEDHDERTWVGRTLRVGGAVLQITRTPKHCLGVYADVRTPGEISVGDAVLL